MVDFNDEEINLYIPRNLSNETEYSGDPQHYQRHYELYKKLLTEKEQEQRQNMDETQAQQQLSDGSSSSGYYTNSSTSSSSREGASTDGASTSSSGSKFFLPSNTDTEADSTTSKDSTSKSTSASSSACVNFPLDSPPFEALNGMGSGPDLSVYLTDLNLTTPGVTSPGAGSDNDTAFSECFTSDVVSQTSSVSSISDISSSAFSDTMSGEPTPQQSDDGGEDTDETIKRGSSNMDGTRRKVRPNITLQINNANGNQQQQNGLGEGEGGGQGEPWQDTPSVSPKTSPVKPEAKTPVKEEKNSLYDDDEFDFLQTMMPVKRSTSLKTNKTPPGTPSRKKAVRFADALGLDLENVKHYLNAEEPPHVPASAMNDLKIGLEEERRSEGMKYISTSFAQPGASNTFFQRVQAQKVLLENCQIENNKYITGTVRVLNVSYHKKVTLRYTVNNWLTHTDLPAQYVQNSNDGPTDRFSFSVSVPPYFDVNNRLQFCIQYKAGSEEFWDSNYGANYIVECYAKASPLLTDQGWTTFV